MGLYCRLAHSIQSSTSANTTLFNAAAAAGSTQALALAMLHGAEIFRVFTEIVSCLTLPQEVFARAGFADQVLDLAGEHDAAPPPGPTQEELLGLLVLAAPGSSRHNWPRWVPGSRPAAPTRGPASRPARPARRADRGVEVAITTLSPIVGTARACRALGWPRSSWYRAHRRSQAPSRPPRPVSCRQPRALAPTERQRVLDVLHAERFWDAAPASVYATLLDEGTYLASISTMYRLLRAASETGDRRRHATHPAKVKPELLATVPNQCWSWDITKLAGPAKWTWYHLYVILDVYSRYVVGWMVAHARPPPWPSGCSPRPSWSRVCRPARSPSTPTGTPR